jgi:hypothetical protein
MDLERVQLSLIKTIENTAVGVYHADHAAPSIAKVGTTSLTSGGRSVGILPLRTEAMEFVC